MPQPNLEHLRHSLAHLLGAAVVDLWPGTKLTLGPAIENGFYYDVDAPVAISQEDLPKIEKKMRELLKTWKEFSGKDATPAEARAFAGDNEYKGELIDEIEKRGEKITLYTSGSFTDLCRGGHVQDTKEIDPKSFTLTTVAGAYWRGDEKNKMLQRIYGLAFATREELDAHLKMLQEAEKRDHRKLGKELKIFSFSDYVGPGLPLWLPNGTVIVEELEQLAKEVETKAGYLRVRTPHIAKKIMYETSGHIPYYEDGMFPPMVMREAESEESYYLKAMNCPHHHQVYAAEPRSYRDLPIRLTEYGTCYRYEQSGELFGLMRVRSMQMNDGHLYCTPAQFVDEFRAVNEMYLHYFQLFGFKKYLMRFSTHDPNELGKKYVNEPALWKKTEDMVREALITSKIEFVEIPNEAAFYGPKIDVQVWSSIGREFTIATNQVDFSVPRRFGLTYTDSDGEDKTPICIHRAPLGTHERFVGFLIEHYAGAFPLWLAPVQVQIVPVGESHAVIANALATSLRELGIRVKVDASNETVGKKIRHAEIMKVPYAIVVGDKEAPASGVWEKESALAVRQRGSKDLLDISLEAFTKQVLQQIQTRHNE